MFRICSRKFSLSSLNLAGHSKWANIKHTKALKDGQKAALFTKYTRQIRIAIQEGGSTNPAMNTQLRNLIDEALKKNMPMATINNSIKKYNANAAKMSKHFLEVKSNRIFMICELYSDNFNGAKMIIASVLKKGGAAYANCQHMFHDVGLIQATYNSDTQFSSQLEFEEKCTEDAIEAGAEEVEEAEHVGKTVTFVCQPQDIEKIRRTLLSIGYTIDNTEHVFIPNTPVKLQEQELVAYDLMKEKLRAIDGFENIYDNVEVIDESS